MWTHSTLFSQKCFNGFLLLKQNAIAAAAAAPYPGAGQYAGYESYPYSSAAAAGKLLSTIESRAMAFAIILLSHVSPFDQ